MAVRKLSARHLQFLLGRAATDLSRRLKTRMPFYNRVVPMIEHGSHENFVETQPLGLTPDQVVFARLLPETLPAEVTRDVALVALDNVTLLGPTGAVVDEARECVLAARGARDFVTYHDFRPVPTRVVDMPPANYFDMVGSYRGHRHFFHFLCERLPRLFYLLEKFPLGTQPLTVLTNEDIPAFQDDLYRTLAKRHPNLEFLAIPGNERWHLPRLYCIDDWQPIKRTFASAEVMDFLRGLVFSCYGLREQAPKARLYVTRADTRKRRVVNEAELLPVLAERGFEIVAPGRLAFPEQVQRFVGAAAVAGPHGAGLTNILFAPKSARALELFPATKVKNTYFLLAKSLDQAYHGLIGGAGRRHEGFTVDARAFAAALDTLLA